MRLSTTRLYRNFVFIYIILSIMLILDIIVVVTGEEGSVGQSPLRLGPIVLVVLLFLLYRGNPVFTYDSDGEVIIVDSKEPSLMRISRIFVKHYEFPKRKLVGYSFSRWPLKRTLTLKIASKDGKRKHISASISYLNRQEVKDLERSLRGVISKNKSMGIIEDNVA